MSLKLYRPVPGGMKPAPVEGRNWRNRLRSRRWGAAPLESKEGKPLTPLSGVIFIGGLAILTFVLLLLGYGTGFWGS